MKQGLKNTFRGKFKSYLSDESGATAIEYGLIAALIGVGLIGGLKAMGGGNAGSWKTMSDKVIAAG